MRRGRADGRATREECAGEFGSVWAQERKAGYRRGVIRGRCESRRDWKRSGWSSKGMHRLCGSESRMGASVELRMRGEASLLQRARTCDNRRRGGSGWGRGRSGQGEKNEEASRSVGVNALGVGGGAGVEMRRDAGGGRGGALGPLPLPLPQPAAALGPHVARSGREPKVSIFRNFAPPIHMACAYFAVFLVN